VVGTVAASGAPLVVPDVTAFPAYIMSDPEIRSEMAAPMRFGDELIGVVDVESRTASAFDDDSLGVLTRLADQIALVAHSNRLLSQQRETMTRLRELDQMKSDFVAITSHELRTPITAIRGFVKTLLRNRERLSDEQIENFMNIIDRQSGRLARLVEDLLFVSRIEAGTIRMQMETVELGDFLRETIEALGPEGRNRVRLRLSPPDSTIVMDPQRMDQIVRNLVENALKFSPPDTEVDIDAFVAEGRLQLAVTDRGPGIPAEDLPNIFDRFHQAGEVLTREAEGAGLGLYITKRLAEAMRGSISVSSVLGSGSTFVVTVPSGSVQEAAQDGVAAGAGSAFDATVPSGGVAARHDERS
jgi:signal transduction histidine kinase